MSSAFLFIFVLVGNQDADLVDYYGVCADEVTAERSQYSPDSALNSSVTTPVIFGGLTRISLTKIWYGNAITATPLVDAAYGLSKISALFK